MKIINFLIFALIFGCVFSQEIKEKEIKTTVKEVTVFLNGAQVNRAKTINLTKGKTILKFVQLSPFIDAKSIQVKAEGEITVVSVNHQQNYLDKSVKSQELINLENQLELLDKKIEIEKTYISIIKEELNFLDANKDIGGNNQGVNITTLKQASDFYSSKLTYLKLKGIERNETLKDLNKKKSDLRNQIKTISTKKEYPTGEILVKVEAKLAKSYPIEISYLVGNASWFPSYDIRAKEIGEPIQITYKANVKQDTKVDWINAKLKFSSANPNISGVAPELKTYFLDYYSAPPTYKLSTLNRVKGKIFDSNNLPLPGANIRVEGTTIGTSSDMDGSFDITIPNNASQLVVSYVGYVTKTIPISSSNINIYLEEDSSVLEEVVVVGYGIRDKKIEGRMKNESKEQQFRKSKSLSLAVTQIENQTTVDFEIKTPYTVKSDNKNYLVEMANYNASSFYQYYCVPKIDKDVFLFANISNWEKYNILEGEANVFFEDTYVGKTLLDVRYARDTLKIPLGRDKKVSVTREKIKDFTTKQFIGNKKEESRSYKIVVKNNKNQEINMIVLDQVPVSTLEEIVVSLDNISGAKHNSENGEIKWDFKLESKIKKEFDLKYSVKYPKNKTLNIE